MGEVYYSPWQTEVLKFMLTLSFENAFRSIVITTGAASEAKETFSVKQLQC